MFTKSQAIFDLLYKCIMLGKKCTLYKTNDTSFVGWISREYIYITCMYMDVGEHNIIYMN